MSEKIQIIPAIDMIDGACVRLTQGDYNQKTEYYKDPLEVAKMFEGAGITRLHLVDLDGAKNKKITNHKVLERIANNTNLIIDFGGGLQSDEDIDIAFSSGASQITGGSIAIRNEPLFMNWIKKYGSEKIILGADAKDKKIAIGGWQEVTNVGINEYIDKFLSEGLKYVISTDVAKDGMMQGPSFDLYKELKSAFPEMFLIASGGVHNMQDIVELNAMGVEGVIVGKAFYEGKISLEDINKFYAN